MNSLKAACLLAFSVPIGCANESADRARAAIDAMARRPPAGLPEGTASGIRLGMPMADVEASCRAAGRTWINAGENASCSGPVVATMARWYREVRLMGCHGHVCAMMFDVDPHTESIELVSAGLVARLESQYGKAMSDTVVPERCMEEGAFLDCVHSGQAIVRLIWEVAPQRWEVVQMAREDDAMHLRVGFFNKALTEKSDDVAQGASRIRGLFSNGPAEGQ